MQYSSILAQQATDYWDAIHKIDKRLLAEETTAFDHLNPTSRHRLWLVKNQVTVPPKCPKCANDAQFNKTDPHAGLREFCSVQCSLTKVKRRHAHDVLAQDGWLYHQRVILRRSTQSVADELGCSAPLVDQYEDKYGIDVDVKNKGVEIDTLRRLFVDEKKTIYEVALLTGISPSSVSRIMMLFDVETRAPNSYDRTHNHRSKAGGEVNEFIESLGFQTKQNDRTILNGFEIDTLVESKKIAFEYNGLYHHQYRPHETAVSRIKGWDYHLNKTLGAQDKGYRLYHIWEDDWLFRRPIVESMIRSRLGVGLRRIHARKCSIGPVTSHEKCEFMNANHIQGKGRASVYLGLKLDGQLVACMSFMKHTDSDPAIGWELSRFATLRDTQVYGAFVRLLTYFRKHHQGGVVSYSDRCYSFGDVYAKHGFTLRKTDTGNYWYVVQGNLNRVDRRGYTKESLVKRGQEPSLTEEQIMIGLGHWKIWGCGTQTWVLGDKSPASAPAS